MIARLQAFASRCWCSFWSSSSGPWAMTLSAPCRTRRSARKGEKLARALSFRLAGRPGRRSRTSTGHSNRLDPGLRLRAQGRFRPPSPARTASYRDARPPEARLYGSLPPSTRSTPRPPSTSTRAISTASRKTPWTAGAKHVFVVWFDGMDWETTRAAAHRQDGQGLRRGEGLRA